MWGEAGNWKCGFCGQEFKNNYDSLREHAICIHDHALPPYILQVPAYVVLGGERMNFKIHLKN